MSNLKWIDDLISFSAGINIINALLRLWSPVYILRICLKAARVSTSFIPNYFRINGPNNLGSKIEKIP